MIPKMIYKNVFVFVFCFSLFALPLFALQDALYNGTDYTLYAQYNKSAVQGDCVFVYLTYIQKKLQKATQKENAFLDTTAFLTLEDPLPPTKTIQKAQFYVINTDLKKQIDFLCGLPIDTYQKPRSYTLTITYRPCGKETLQVVLPFSVEKRDFVFETIPLDKNNTNIKKDASDTRLKQIQKLNDILFTTNLKSVYEVSSFVCPLDPQGTGKKLRYTSYFGDRRTYTYTTGGTSLSLHYGNDYGVPTGTQVFACAAGRVVMAETRVTTGFSVVIEHLPGLYSLYYHLSKMEVCVGQDVKKGQLIAQSGSTGLATGPHLHWEIRLLGQAVRPEFFLTFGMQ